MPGLFKCSYKNARKLVEKLKEDTDLMKLSKAQLVDKIRELERKNKELMKERNYYSKEVTYYREHQIPFRYNRSSNRQG